MNLAEELAVAATAAAAHRNGAVERERRQLEQLEKLRHQLEQELADDKDEASLDRRQTVLLQEVEALRAEVTRLEEETGRQRKQLQDLLAQGAVDLQVRTLRLEEETAGRRLTGRLLSALDAFGFDHAEAVPAEILAGLPKLIQQAARVRRNAGKGARDLSQKIEDERERIAAWRLLEEEEASLRGRECELLEHLRLHGREDREGPPLVRSLAEADLRTLRLFRERVLEPLLNDLAAEEEHWLTTQGTDPLSEFTSTLRAIT